VSNADSGCKTRLPKHALSKPTIPHLGSSKEADPRAKQPKHDQNSWKATASQTKKKNSEKVCNQPVSTRLHVGNAATIPNQQAITNSFNKFRIGHICNSPLQNW
jgi:hypothetical protein